MTRFSQALLEHLAEHDVVDIIVAGRRTGIARRVEIWVRVIEQRVYIAGTPGPRSWLANLRVNPRLTLQVKTLAEQPNLALVAEIVTDPAERRRLFARPELTWYRQRSTLDDLVAAAPLVELRRRS